MTPSIDRDYFEQLYASDPDPWRFATSDYERDKYARTLEALSRPKYASALEIGCSIGVLTRLLADRCDRLLALDIADAPLAEARRRSLDAPWVSFARMAVPTEWPEGTFDLILLSEVVYYLDAADVAALGRHVSETLVVGGDLLLAHWTGGTNYPLSGDQASELLLGGLEGVLEEVRHERFDRFRVDFAKRAAARP